MRTRLELLLGDWGRWKCRENASPLGYPTEAAFAKDKVDHGGWGSVSPDVPLVDDDLRRADVAINGLHPNGRLMVIAHYIWIGPVKMKADKMRMSPARYYFRLAAAHEEIAQRMGGMYLQGYDAVAILSRDVEQVSR